MAVYIYLPVQDVPGEILLRQIPDPADGDGESYHDPENWAFDVATALHDDLKTVGPHKTIQSRVVISRADYPDWRIAAQVAGCIAVSIHGGMPTYIYPRY